MKDAESERLRELWKLFGNTHCDHRKREAEYSFSGRRTGYSLCTECGDRQKQEEASRTRATE